MGADAGRRRHLYSSSDAEVAWATASALVDDLAARQPLLRARPTRQEVACPAGSALFAVKGTCCLIYKTNMPVDRADRGDRAARRESAVPWIHTDACSSCPLRMVSEREVLLAGYLTERANRANRGNPTNHT